MRMWKSFRTNMMYWRFRYITRNRLRLQSWFRRRQAPHMARPTYARNYHARGTAASVYHRSSRRSWIILFIMVAMLTALRVWSNHSNVNATLVYVLGVVVIIGSLYWAVNDA